jgi:triacylglycerol lipase
MLLTDHDSLTPREAAYIAHNCYFTLKDWITGQPVAGMETRANVRKMVLGDGVGAAQKAGGANTSLRGTQVGGAKLDRVFQGSTAGLQTGFGYVLRFNRNGQHHAVIATRGTRAEHSKSDLYTDAHGSLTGFAGYGLVHTGFKNIFDSIRGGLASDDTRIMDADVVHCVGHSLGGAVATLVAAHYRSRGKAVKLYTFGCPRVGAFGAHRAMEQEIGKLNVYRVSHDLDPVTMVGPYPFGHLNPDPQDVNNMMMTSPTGRLLSVANHDMNEYVLRVSRDRMTWDSVRALGAAVDHDNAVMARWLLRSSDNPGWLTRQAAKGLTYLMKAFSGLLLAAGLIGVTAFTAIDLLVAVLASNMSKVAELNADIREAMRQAAGWAGIVISGAAQITVQVVRGILDAMMRVLKPIAIQALFLAGTNGSPLPLILTGAAALTGSVIC